MKPVGVDAYRLNHTDDWIHFRSIPWRSPWLPHPVRLIGRMAIWAEPRCRQLITNEYLAGAVFTLAVVTAARWCCLADHLGIAAVASGAGRAGHGSNSRTLDWRPESWHGRRRRCGRSCRETRSTRPDSNCHASSGATLSSLGARDRARDRRNGGGEHRRWRPCTDVLCGPGWSAGAVGV